LAPPRSGRIQPDKPRLFLLVIGSSRPTLTEEPLADLSLGNDAVDEMRSFLCYPAVVAEGTDAAFLAASHRQGGPSMAPFCRAADGNAKGSRGCLTRLIRAATTKPCPHEAQRTLPNPKHRMPQVRYVRRTPPPRRVIGIQLFNSRRRLPAIPTTPERHGSAGT
jgi:hypothetical protein